MLKPPRYPLWPIEALLCIAVGVLAFTAGYTLRPVAPLPDLPAVSAPVAIGSEWDDADFRQYGCVVTGYKDGVVIFDAVEWRPYSGQVIAYTYQAPRERTVSIPLQLESFRDLFTPHK